MSSSFLTDMRAPRIASATTSRRSNQGRATTAGAGRAVYRPVSAPVRRASDASRERAAVMLRLRKRSWEDQRPIQSLSELPDAIKSRTKQVEDERTRAFIASQKKVAHHHHLSTRPSSLLSRKPKSRGTTASGSGGGGGGGSGGGSGGGRGGRRRPGGGVDSRRRSGGGTDPRRRQNGGVDPSASPAAAVLAELEVAQRSYTRKLTSPKQVGFMRALHRIEKKHNITSFTQHLQEFKARSPAERLKRRAKRDDDKLQWRTLKLGP